MSEQKIITWNFTNWVTVVAMVAIGFVGLTLLAQVYHNRVSSKS